MLWQIRTFPRCTYHVFLSHSAEDRLRLVHPVHQAIEARGVSPWLDQNDYCYGRPSRAALRDGILASRHTVFFITEAQLVSPRGWCVMELTLAEIVNSNFQVRGGQLANTMLPLFFIDPRDERLLRSVWQDLRDLGRFIPLSHATVDPVEWATNEIMEFLKREQLLSMDMAKVLRCDKELRGSVKAVQGMTERVSRFEPVRIPT